MDDFGIWQETFKTADGIKKFSYRHTQTCMKTFNHKLKCSPWIIRMKPYQSWGMTPDAYISHLIQYFNYAVRQAFSNPLPEGLAS